ncbi:alpha/beta hydrolase [Marinactinospora rubrisoli]|uniref:Alpha/beta hydrolase n=1 Tax=Marinactinospora rubrisoli TaxID=2715399 RepID=A0ABW2KEH6_9ACTN
MARLTRTLAVPALLAAMLGTAGPAAAEAVPGPLDYTAVPSGGRQVLAEDPAGSGRIVELLGDLATAEHVAIVVPGSGQHLGNFRNDPEHPGTVPVSNGENLLAEAQRQRPDARVAVIVWLGYLPPQSLNLAAVTSGRAREGATELARFVRLVRGRAPEGVHVTLVCHSYGSVVGGLAVRQPGVADDVVALASPGMGVDTADRLHARVWATRAADDWIRFVPHIRLGPVGHGADPVAPGFGARVFAATGAHGHEQYYRPGGATLTNTARIVLGDHDDVPVRAA